jgi:nicotinate-nucleotide adenylyltransferase
VFSRPGHESATESAAARDLARFRIDAARASELADMRPPAWVFLTATENPLSSTQLRSRAE